MSRTKGFLRESVPIVLLCLLVVGCNWRIGLAGRVLAGGDVFSYFYPYWAESTRAIRAGRLPLWNPSLFMGVPFAANSQAGFFYPLNWPLWLLLPAHRSVHLAMVLHLCLAAAFAYLWGRGSLRLGRIGSWAMGAMFALGGYLGAQTEHVNQVQGLAWLPLILLLVDRITRSRIAVGAASGPPRGRRTAGLVFRQRLRACCVLALVIGLVLLAGHTQTAFISLLGMVVYGVVPALWRSVRGGGWRGLTQSLALLAGGATAGVGVAAIQLLPTWELSRLSVRAGGLPFNERVSFSLSPLYAGRTLLPVFAGTVSPEHIEHVAYVGVTGLALAVVGLAIGLGRDRGQQSGGVGAYGGIYALVLLGLSFALGLYNPLYLLLARYVPGFAHFRVPARWLALYVVGIAAIGGRAVQALWEGLSLKRRHALLVACSLAVLISWGGLGLWSGGMRKLASSSLGGWAAVGAAATGLILVARRSPRTAAIGLTVLLIGELTLGGQSLPRARATAPDAFTSLRPAVAHLLASEGPDAGPRGRFLSMSDTTFDPGDLSLIETIYGPQLSEEQLYDYIVASTQKEVLTPNLPLAFGVPAVDGYDGGLLPLRRYVTLQRAFLSAPDVSMDGRLRENITTIPAGRWLSLLNVRYVITDKLQDSWIDDVFYDLQFGARLSGGETAAVAEVPAFEATTLGVVSRLEPEDALSGCVRVGEVEVGFDDGSVQSFTLRAEDLTGKGAGERDAEEWAVTRLRWSEPRIPTTVTVEGMVPRGTWVVGGVSLIDVRTGSFQSLVLSDRGRFRLAHSGDVKIYENLGVLPRAFVVPEARVVADDDAALRAVKEPTFEPASEVVLSAGATLGRGAEVTPTLDGGGRSAGGRAVGQAVITSYQPERVVIQATLKRAGYLVLSDAQYPGWQVSVDGETRPIHRADVLFRAVALEAGQHQVIFRFRSTLQRAGLAVTLGVLAVLLIVWHERRIAETLVGCYNRMHGWATGLFRGPVL